ncbi:MAG TPA: hypothetical protein VES95_05350 [Dermatophilaceae bacterium]|nr:hypothetical protein [Dermatophilaceae bacterium]
MDLDRAARALGVSSDDGIADAVQSFQARADVAGDELGSLRQALRGGVCPEAEDALDRALAAVVDAERALNVVRQAAEDHARGER